jgi:hypothetical protein
MVADGMFDKGVTVDDDGVTVDDDGVTGVIVGVEANAPLPARLRIKMMNKR